MSNVAVVTAEIVETASMTVSEPTKPVPYRGNSATTGDFKAGLVAGRDEYQAEKRGRRAAKAALDAYCLHAVFGIEIDAKALVIAKGLEKL